MASFLIIVAFSYLVGSIPFGYILVRAFRGQDIRQSGSGNIGATNVSRSSPVLGVATLLLDVGKGAAAVFLAGFISRVWDPMNPLSTATITIRSAIAGACVILGHMFPVWLKFKGGKGVATALGVFIIFAPKTTLITIGIFAAVVLVFRYVSLGSIIAVMMFPLLAWLLCDYAGDPVVLALMSFASVAIVLKHHENITRLLSGTESRFQLRRG